MYVQVVSSKVSLNITIGKVWVDLEESVVNTLLVIRKRVSLETIWIDEN